MVRVKAKTRNVEFYLVKALTGKDLHIVEFFGVVFVDVHQSLSV